MGLKRKKLIRQTQSHGKAWNCFFWSILQNCIRTHRMQYKDIRTHNFAYERIQRHRKQYYHIILPILCYIMPFYAFRVLSMHSYAERRGQDKGSGPTFLGSPLPVLPSLGVRGWLIRPGGLNVRGPKLAPIRRAHNSLCLWHGWWCDLGKEWEVYGALAEDWGAKRANDGAWKGTDTAQATGAVGG